MTYLLRIFEKAESDLIVADVNLKKKLSLQRKIEKNQAAPHQHGWIHHFSCAAVIGTESISVKVVNEAPETRKHHTIFKKKKKAADKKRKAFFHQRGKSPCQTKCLL